MDTPQRILFSNKGQIKDIKLFKFIKDKMADNFDKGLSPNNEANKYETFKSIGFFNAGEHFNYVFKKTERIVHGLYIVTNHIKDMEPIKLELRERALSLFTISLELNSPEVQDQNALVGSFFAAVLEIMPFLDLAAVSGHISMNNSSLLYGELNNIVTFLKNKISLDIERSGLILSKDFFAIQAEKSSEKGIQNKKILPTVSRSEKDVHGSNPAPKEKKDSRQNAILDLLKRQSNLTVKDFVNVITDCSEKTIQRELIDLVEKKLVRKEGERRWSRYSLNS